MKSYLNTVLVIVTAAFCLETTVCAAPEDVARKGRERIIPELDIKDLSATDALNVVSRATGIRVFYTPAPADKARINLRKPLKNVTATQAFTLVTGLSNLKFRYESDGVHVIPQLAEFGPLK